MRVLYSTKEPSSKYFCPIKKKYGVARQLSIYIHIYIESTSPVCVYMSMKPHIYIYIYIYLCVCLKRILIDRIHLHRDKIRWGPSAKQHKTYSFCRLSTITRKKDIFVYMYMVMCIYIYIYISESDILFHKYGLSLRRLVVLYRIQTTTSRSKDRSPMMTAYVRSTTKSRDVGIRRYQSNDCMGKSGCAIARGHGQTIKERCKGDSERWNVGKAFSTTLIKT